MGYRVHTNVPTSASNAKISVQSTFFCQRICEHKRHSGSGMRTVHGKVISISLFFITRSPSHFYSIPSHQTGGPFGGIALSGRSGPPHYSIREPLYKDIWPGNLWRFFVLLRAPFHVYISIASLNGFVSRHNPCTKSASTFVCSIRIRI
jgi:hypothetical protein